MKSALVTIAGNATALPTSGSTTHFERNIWALAVLEQQENQRRKESSGTYALTSQSQQQLNPSYTQRYSHQSHYTGIEPAQFS